MGNIFISHVIADEPLMREIAQGLEEEGYAAWFFERDVLPGTSYLIQITRAMEACDALVLVVTPSALESDQVTKEVVGAFERGIPFVPVLVGVTPPELKECQPEWRHALGGTAMLCCGEGELSPTIPRIIEGLRALGIEPGGREFSTTTVSSAPGDVSERALSYHPSMMGERKQVTVLCVGASPPSALLEKLDPEEVHDLLRPAVDIMAEEVRRYEGTVAQLAGDGLTALFGAPLSHEDDPQRALYAVQAAKRRLAGYEKRLKDKGMELALRAGLNTGLIKVEAVGEDLSMQYTPLGDTVNLAAQLKSAAGPGEILVSETTLRLAEGYFEFAQTGEVEVEGRKQPAWVLLKPGPARTRISASLARGLSPFVGRERELEHLAHCYERAKGGSGQVVGVVGEPGMGKSRLLLEFRKALHEEEHTYLEGGCIHYGEAMPYLPILDILRDYFDIEEGEREDAVKEKLARGMAGLDGHLDQILSPIKELLSLPVEDESYLSLEPAQRRERTFEAIRNLLIAESQKRPLVVSVEDLHWMDKTSEDFLSSFIESMPGASILLLLLYRPDFTPAWTSRTLYSQVRVESLPQSRSAELVEGILAEGEVSREISDFITEKAAGNPLFVEELTRSLLESGSIARENGRYSLASEPSEIKVPDTVQGIIASRLDRLPEEEKDVLQVASVIGREFSLRLLEEVTGLGKVLKSSLHALQSLEFTYEKSLFPEPEYIFKHALTQEVAYESLPLKRRRELHERTGIAIERLYPDTLEDFYETLAHHYSKSENADKAVHYLMLSADKSARNYSNWEAVSFYKETIQVLNGQPESEENKNMKIAVYLLMLNPLLLMGFPQGSVEILQEAESLAEDVGDDASLAAIYSKASLYHSFKGDIPLSIEYSEKCFDTAEKMGDMDSMAMTALDLGPVMTLTGRLLEMAAISRRVIELLEEKQKEKDLFAGGLNVYVNQRGYCALALGVLGEFEAEQDVFEKGLASSLEFNDLFGIGWMEYNHCIPCFYKGDGEGMIDHALKAIECFEEIGVEVILGMAWSYLGVGHYLLGDYEAAMPHAEKGLEIQEQSGFLGVVPFLHSFLALIRLAAGDLDGALESAGEGLRASRDYRARYGESIALLALGRAEGEADPSRVEAAVQYIRQSISMAEEMKMNPSCALGFLFLGEVFEIAGREGEALENLRKAEEMYLEMGVGPDSCWLTRDREALARLGQG